MLPFQKDKRTKPGNLPKKRCCFKKMKVFQALSVATTNNTSCIVCSGMAAQAISVSHLRFGSVLCFKRTQCFLKYPTNKRRRMLSQEIGGLLRPSPTPYPTAREITIPKNYLMTVTVRLSTI